ncbi:MAG: YggN family protein [Alteromonadaceae bacterium]|nr:YggN family protein [Alteromonadaceae bacterium]
MKTLSLSSFGLVLAPLSLLVCSSAIAHDSCNVELDAGMKISKQAIEFFKGDEKDRTSLYKIVNNDTLYVNGKQIDLTSDQQSLVKDYSTSIRAVVPEVKNIALEGIDLAVDGVNLAFNELLGKGNSVGEDLTFELGKIRKELDARFSTDGGFYIDENGMNMDEVFGDEFETRIESVVEEAVMHSMGSILIAVGQELLFSGGDMDSFETRMESFGEQIEYEMETRSEAIEAKAEALCHSIAKIDHLEEQLKAEISELEEFNVLVVDNDNHDSI